MIFRTLSKLLLIALFLSVLTPIIAPALIVRAFPDNCGLNPSNLFRNGSMAPGHDTPFGVVAQDWEPFVIKGSPRFEWVDNEKWDANGAQYFWSDSVPFDAGIYQTVGGLQPNNYYRFRIGYSHARLDPGNAQNEVHPSMGRQVGVDPFGGTDPKSPNVIWGPALFNSGAGMNPPDLTMTFAARADKATMYFRGLFTGASGRAKVWFDVACMEFASDLPTATAPAPTATPVPPTATARPAALRAPSTATKIPPSPTRAPTNAPTAIAVTPTDEPTQVALVVDTTPAATATPRRARVDVTPVVAAEAIDLGMGLAIGSGIALILGAVIFFGIGLWWWMRAR